MQCFSIVPHEKKTNDMIIVQKEATVGVNSNNIFKIRRQHMFYAQVSQRVLLYTRNQYLSNYLKMPFPKSGKTQNQNESFNGVTWQRIPKDVRVNVATFEMGVYDTPSHFNLGNIYNQRGFNSGYYTLFALDCNMKEGEQFCSKEY